MFSRISPGKRVPPNHPLRLIRTLLDRVLEQLSPRFNKLLASRSAVDFAREATESVVVEFLYLLRNARLLREQIDYNLPFGCFGDSAWTMKCCTPASFPRTENTLRGGYR
jgi:hypothetical protein